MHGRRGQTAHGDAYAVARGSPSRRGQRFLVTPERGARSAHTQRDVRGAAQTWWPVLRGVPGVATVDTVLFLGRRKADQHTCSCHEESRSPGRGDPGTETRKRLRESEVPCEVTGPTPAGSPLSPSGCACVFPRKGPSRADAPVATGHPEPPLSLHVFFGGVCPRGEAPAPGLPRGSSGHVLVPERRNVSQASAVPSEGHRTHGAAPLGSSGTRQDRGQREGLSNTGDTKPPSLQLPDGGAEPAAQRGGLAAPRPRRWALQKLWTRKRMTKLRGPALTCGELLSCRRGLGPRGDGCRGPRSTGSPAPRGPARRPCQQQPGVSRESPRAMRPPGRFADAWR